MTLAAVVWFFFKCKFNFVELTFEVLHYFYLHFQLNLEWCTLLYNDLIVGSEQVTSFWHFYTDEINSAAHSIVTLPNCVRLIVNSISVYIYPAFISVIGSLVQNKTQKLAWRHLRGVKSRFYSLALLGSRCTLSDEWGT